MKTIIILAALLLQACDAFEEVDCHDEFDSVLNSFGNPDQLIDGAFSSGERWETWYYNEGFSYSFYWGGIYSRCEITYIKSR